MENASASTSNPVPDSVANALMSIHPRYNSFHQHNAFPAGATVGSLGARYEQHTDSPGMASNHQNGLSTGNGGNTTVQPAATSVINLSNSSDVVIGPMTQYQGSVTIYQYMDATVEASRIANGYNNQNKLMPSNTEAGLKHERLIIYSVICLLIIAGLLLLFYVIYMTYPVGDKIINKEIFFEDDSYSKTIPNLGNGHMVIDRNNWGAQQGVHGPYELTHPIPYVLITHIGVHSENCSDVHVCSIKMRTLQDAAIAERSLHDIPSNFYIGGDGNVYVGRGWDTANAYANMSLAICFMGDYGRYEPNDLQLSALEHLMTYGEQHDLLTKDYKIVAHGQTRSTRSPGIKLYEKITKLSRWYPCGRPGYDPCGVEIGLPAVWNQEYPKATTATLSLSSNITQTV
uniref:Peptidoglycan recognition protein family domain-containing protein n=1 Tax=Anopheles culicifacies TaxID=139723 RepID=A0A3F2YVD5_9DIPT